MSRTLKIHQRDNVEVVLESDSDIPMGHKVSNTRIAEGSEIIKYGYPIGRATTEIQPGTWVHAHNMETGLSGTLDYRYEPVLQPLEPIQDNRTFMGYSRANGEVGVRNEIWIVPTVGCVNGLAEKAALQMRRSELPDSIDDVVVFSHPYGCSQLGDDHETSRTILADLIKHPNAGGVLVIGLGCENNTMGSFKKLLGSIDETRVKFLLTQHVEDELEVCKDLLTELVETVQKDSREPLPVSKLRIGLKCGGSDAFSGITANALAGSFSDHLIARGGSTVLTEIPEAFGAESILFNRCINEGVFDQSVELINSFKNYFIEHGEPIGENPSPGNKQGGITTLEDKSLGCVQKGGRAPLTDVLRYGERIKSTGLTLLEGPGNDIVAVTALAAAGCQIVLFTTGRGTPLGGPVPVVKITSNTSLAERKKNWTDYNAGVLLEGATMNEVGNNFFEYLIEIASGVKTRNEENGYRDFAIWKKGITL